MNCPACGAPNPADAKFCNQCGAALGNGCPQCGHGNSSESRFCNACGSTLASAAPAAASAVATAPVSALTADAASAAGPPPPLVALPASAVAQGLALAPAAGAAANATAMAGERKQVTVMFADVRGFTSMSEHLDPEDVHGIMNRCFEILVREVHRYEGTINQFTGDGIMALFGAPTARTDSAQRAVLAGLSIQHALEDLSDDLQEERGIAFRMRIGLNTGMAVVGAVGSEGRQDYTAVGDTTNLAARMEEMAEPGTILITENTYRLVSHDFACESLGERRVRGRTAPVEAYRVRGLTAGHAHAGRDDAGVQGAFVGREEELRVLKKHVERGLAGDARVIGVMAEIGVGKSRLVHELLNTIDRDRVLVAKGHCLSYGAGVAYMPFLDLLRDLEPCLDDPDCAQGALAGLFPSGETAGLLLDERAGINALLVAGRPALEGGDGLGAAKQTIFTRFLDGLFRAGDAGPLLLVIEDLQWIDPTSEELLGDLIRGMPGKRMCLICTFTPGYRFPWADRSYYRHITIDPLSGDQSAAVVRSLLGGTRVPPELLALVQDGAEGNPHYIQASLRMLQEDGFLEQTPEGVRIARPLSEAHIPDSIQDIVMANIDRLEESVKRTLQVAAVIGRVFDVPLLAAVLRAEGGTPQLDALVAAELITSRGPDTYVFRQGVTREVAYASLLRSRRRELHHRVGLALEWLYADRLEEVYARLGYHYAKGDDPERAIQYLRRGARSLRRMGLMHEGADQLDQALTLLTTLPDTPERGRLRVDLLEELAELRFLGGAMTESARLSAEALELAQQLDYTRKLGRLYVHLGGLGGLGASFREDALDLLQKGLQLCEASGDEAMLSRGYMHLGNALRAAGRWAEAESCFERMIGVGRRIPETLGDMVGPCMLAYVACDTGRVAQAREYAEQALRAAETHGIEWARAFAAAFTSDVYFEAGAFAKADELARVGLELGERLGVAFAVTNARSTLGRLAFARGDYREALRIFKQNLENSGGVLAFSARVRLGEAALALGRTTQAYGYAGKALDHNPSLKDVGRAERLMAHVLATRTPPDLEQAQELVRRSVERYQSLDMPLELGLSLAVEGYVARAGGDGEAAGRRFDQAHALLAAAGAQWRVQELARIRGPAGQPAAPVL